MGLVLYYEGERDKDKKDDDFHQVSPSQTEKQTS
jgi:hypothetical protein